MAFADAGKWLLVSLNEHCWVSWQSNRLPVNLHKNISSIQVCWAPCRPLSNNWQDQHSNPARHEMRQCTSRFIAEHQWQLQSQGKLPWVKAWSLKLYLFRTTFSISCAKIHEELWHWYLGNWMKMPKAWRLTREDFANVDVFMLRTVCLCPPRDKCAIYSQVQNIHMLSRFFGSM